MYIVKKISFHCLIIIDEYFFLFIFFYTMIKFYIYISYVILNILIVIFFANYCAFVIVTTYGLMQLFETLFEFHFSLIL